MRLSYSIQAAAASMIGQGGSTLQIGADLLGVIAEGTVDLFVEVRIAVVDEVDVLVAVHRPPPAEVRLLPLLVHEVRHQALDGSLGRLWGGPVGQVVGFPVEVWIACLQCLICLHQEHNISNCPIRQPRTYQNRLC